MTTLPTEQVKEVAGLVTHWKTLTNLNLIVPTSLIWVVVPSGVTMAPLQFRENLAFWEVPYLALGTLWAFTTGALLTIIDVFLGNISLASEYSLKREEKKKKCLKSVTTQ